MRIIGRIPFTSPHWSRIRWFVVIGAIVASSLILAGVWVYPIAQERWVAMQLESNGAHIEWSPSHAVY
jgi:hypothetical protein